MLGVRVQGNSAKNFILARLAHARDAELTFRDLILKGCRRLGTDHAGSALDGCATIRTEKVPAKGFEEVGHLRALVVFHVYIIPHSEAIASLGWGLFQILAVLSPCYIRVYVGGGGPEGPKSIEFRVFSALVLF